MSRSVLQSWATRNLSLKMQAVLLASVRGPDGVRKYSDAKVMTRALRSCFLVAAHPIPNDYLGYGPDLEDRHVDEFLEDVDEYPYHWLAHFMHAAEVVGYWHPNETTRGVWNRIYRLLCGAMHVTPESFEEMNVRLSDPLSIPTVGNSREDS